MFCRYPMVDIKVDVTAAVDKVTGLKDNKLLPKEGLWRYVVIGGIGFFAVLVLLFIGFIIKSILLIAVFIVIVVVAILIGVGVSRWQASKNNEKN